MQLFSKKSTRMIKISIHISLIEISQEIESLFELIKDFIKYR